MIDRPVFDLERKERHEFFNVAQLESDMAAKRAELAAALECVEQSRKAWQEARESGDKQASEAAWRTWKDSRQTYAKLVEGTAVYERERGKIIALPDGGYSLDISFTHSLKKELVIKSEPLFAEAHDTNLGDMLPHAWGAISMLGPHNFGFFPGSDSQNYCDYTLKGPNNFTYRSRVLVDAGGQIIRRAEDVG